MVKNNKKKGNRYECELAKLFRELGWADCKTSRYASKFLDDQNVDLTNTDPFQIQAKSTQQIGNPYQILKSMPQTGGLYNIIFNKRLREGEIVIMSKSDFIKILKLLIENKLICT